LLNSRGSLFQKSRTAPNHAPDDPTACRFQRSTCRGIQFGQRHGRSFSADGNLSIEALGDSSTAGRSLTARRQSKCFRNNAGDQSGIDRRSRTNTRGYRRRLAGCESRPKRMDHLRLRMPRDPSHRNRPGQHDLASSEELKAASTRSRKLVDAARRVSTKQIPKRANGFGQKLRDDSWLGVSVLPIKTFKPFVSRRHPFVPTHPAHGLDFLFTRLLGLYTRRFGLEFPG
jgi:hypothetical protein